MHKRKQTLNHSILGGRRFGPVVIEPLVTAIPMTRSPWKGIVNSISWEMVIPRRTGWFKGEKDASHWVPQRTLSDPRQPSKKKSQSCWRICGDKSVNSAGFQRLCRILLWSHLLWQYYFMKRARAVIVICRWCAHYQRRSSVLIYCLISSRSCMLPFKYTSQ